MVEEVTEYSGDRMFSLAILSLYTDLELLNIFEEQQNSRAMLPLDKVPYLTSQTLKSLAPGGA